MIESLAAVTALSGTGGSQIASMKSADGIDFGSFISGELAKVDSNLQQADVSIRSLAAGGEIPIHDVMIQIETARMSLMLVTEVRNRAVEAYQELMRMQL